MTGMDVQSAQKILYDFFLSAVKAEPADSVLDALNQLFFSNPELAERPELARALCAIVASNNEEQFLFTLKRICYILINNWGIQRQADPISSLVEQFSESTLSGNGAQGILPQMRRWMRVFLNSEALRDLKLFAARYEQAEHWSDRYTSYLLAPQYLNLENPIEQRTAARALSRQLKSRFRFDLAMYAAKAQASSLGEGIANPTVLGESALKLIKLLLLQPGQFGYENLAHLFRRQCIQLSYWDFKRALLHYLTFGLPPSTLAERLKEQLPEPLLALYPHHNRDTVNNALVLRTCKQLVDLLTISSNQEPSLLFNLFLVQGNPLLLVILLLKLVLFCPYLQSHLELRIADLIRYYEAYSEEDCRWVVNFFEVFRITFAVYASANSYNLVPIEASIPEAEFFDLSNYRIFSQLRQAQAQAPEAAPSLEENRLQV